MKSSWIHLIKSCAILILTCCHTLPVSAHSCCLDNHVLRVTLTTLRTQTMPGWRLLPPTTTTVRGRGTQHSDSLTSSRGWKLPTCSLSSHSTRSCWRRWWKATELTGEQRWWYDKRLNWWFVQPYNWWWVKLKKISPTMIGGSNNDLLVHKIM